TLFGICNLQQRRIALFLNAFKREARATSGAHPKSTFLVVDFSPEFPGGRARGSRSKSTGYQKYLLPCARILSRNWENAFGMKKEFNGSSWLGLTFGEVEMDEEDLIFMVKGQLCGGMQAFIKFVFSMYSTRNRYIC
ncbi:hypothetical protein CEXT_287021, partial [Caerostris extrusa]